VATKLISPKNITKAEAKRILDLINQWTRCEIIARLGKFNNLGFGEYAKMKIEKADELRKLIYGTSNLVKLGERWGLLKRKEVKETPRRKKVKRKETKRKKSRSEVKRTE